jgi:hypothetical protein
MATGFKLYDVPRDQLPVAADPPLPAGTPTVDGALADKLDWKQIAMMAGLILVPAGLLWYVSRD